MMEVTDKREMMANQLLMRGHATMLELMTASFGEWPPKGLDVDPNIKHDQVVTLNIFQNDGLNGQASSPKQMERVISVHQNLVDNKDGANSTLGHEAIHILQGDNAARKADTFGRQMNIIKKVATAFFGQETATSDIIMNNMLNSNVGGLSAEFNASVRDLDREGWRSEVRYINYLRQGIEVQARIHQIIIDGYPRWGKVPTTPDEFHAAMKSAGIKLPADIEQRLADLPANSSARAFMNVDKPSGHILNKIVEINAVNDSFDANGQATLWHKVMPALYTDLMHMYGDKSASKKMGFNTDIKKAATLQIKRTAPAAG